VSNEWTNYTNGSINNATPDQWDKVSKTLTGKLYHPQDNHDPVGAPDHYNRGAIEAILCTHRSTRGISRVTA
jgi:hypothetical protein